MAKKALVIVESPSKAKTIQKYLGRDYIVKASVGHVKDLPKSKLGVNVEKGFKPEYQVIPAKVKVIEELKKYSAQVPELYLATDPDREGEAIAWHVNEELKARGKKVHRVLFNSVTKSAVLEAMSKPLKLNEDKYNAQQARRILDRLVGYKVSPLLWDKVKRGISAGRVQSVALRLVVERETEIKAFKPEEYWQMEGVFAKPGDREHIQVAARLFKVDGKDPELPSQSSIDTLTADLKGAKFSIGAIEQKERSRKPTAPFITSRLQQEAARKLGFSAKKTMTLAQKLYEGVDLGDLGQSGLITYMRTDSVRIEPQAIEEARGYITQKYGAEYVPAEPNQYKSKANAQEAHEAIRPTSLEFTPERVQGFLDRDEFRLYQLIWNRFLASQMTPAVYDQTAVDITTRGGKSGLPIVFRATGSVVKFAGFTAVYSETREDASGSKRATDAASDDDENALKLPAIVVGDAMALEELKPSQHFTQPPPRYSDASLIRELEDKGIGRPSTYASILSNLQDREYVEKREARYYPSELGTVVTELLVQSFPDLFDVTFTAEMEAELDQIEDGTMDWQKIMGRFWKPFEKTLESAKKHMKNVKVQEVPTDIICDKCGNRMVIKWGKMGSFLACSGYPECKNTQDFKKDEAGKIVVVPKEFTDKKCERCSSPMVVKNGKFGKFLACSNYPNCKFTAAITIGIHCPDCKIGELVQKQSRFRRVFYSCNRWAPNNAGCTFACWDRPVGRACPKCGYAILSEKITKKQGLIEKCVRKECGYMEVLDPNAGKEPPAEEPGTPAQAAS